MHDPKSYIRWFGEIAIDDVGLVGGKTASLGEMYQQLSGTGVRIPNGFAITAEAYRDLLHAHGAWEQLALLTATLDPTNVPDLQQKGAEARRIVFEAGVPAPIQSSILDAYAKLRTEYGDGLTLAVRSSATAEDLPDASFAGQQETFLNIAGEDELLLACRRCFASLFTDRAIAYRANHGFDHMTVALSIAVMKMVRSDLSASGVMFSIDTETGYPDAVFITAAYGLGETVVQGTVSPDEFYVHKPTYEQGYRSVLRRQLGEKLTKMVYGSTGDPERTTTIATSEADRRAFCITDDEVLELAGFATAIERHYSERAGKPVPMDIEWARDGLDGKLYIVQARPETVASRKAPNVIEHHELLGQGEVLATGRAVGTRIASGRARIIHSTSDLDALQPGEILVAETTTPDWGPVMKRAGALVTRRGGRTCHAAIVARELGIPAVVGASESLSAIVDGAMVTVSCAEGETGRVYADVIPSETRTIAVEQLPRPRTQVMVNLGNPDAAFRTSALPVDGVGLARMEFIISEHIRVHPLALLHPEKVPDKSERIRIEEMLRGGENGTDFFVRQLSEGVGTIAAAFYPRPVVVRLSDFKTDEYANLIGGRAFEPVEANPMLGFRGAARYAHPDYRDEFNLECAAMKRVRDDMGLTNTILMVPFCRSLREADQVLEIMAEQGLRRGVLGLQVYVMCELPNNVILIDAFAQRFDGFSIGSNDLTQLILGVDRSAEMVAPAFDERDEGVLEAMRLAVEGARRNSRHSGICGQAPSDYPEVAEFLVRAGIESISLTPDTVIEGIRLIHAAEQKLATR